MLKRCYLLGRLKVDRAIETCTQLIERHPWHHIAHDQLARQYHRKGNRKKAQFHYQRAVDIYPKFPRAKRELRGFKKKKRKRANGKRNTKSARALVSL